MTEKGTNQQSQTGDNHLKNKITKDNYKSYVFEKSPKSAHAKNMFWAFVIGGTICVIGQIFIEVYSALGFSNADSSALASATLVVITAILTGFGVFDQIGRFAGAGSTIPITGFANAVVAPALEFKAEGLIYGLGAKMFVVAGPVIVNGVFVSVIIALLTLLIGG
ncbi:MAG: stage V sporulation protein AC [Clostridia bacterium]|nr:stage V sporulation protein AC [Clostridia bacterium]